MQPATQWKEHFKTKEKNSLTDVKDWHFAVHTDVEYGTFYGAVDLWREERKDLLECNEI